MPITVLADGVTHTFPDGASQDEISQALNGGSKPAANPRPAASIIKPASTPGISAAPPRNGIMANVSGYLSDIGDDIRHGSGVTLPGRALAALGAKGTDTGNSHELGEYMASPVLGPTRMLQGAAELPQSGKFTQGAKNLAGGAVQTAQFPMSMLPEGGIEAADKIPSFTRAGENFQAVARGAGNIPIDTTEARGIIARARELGSRGSFVPKVVKDLGKATAINEVGAPGEVPYSAGRDFASNAGKLSKSEAMKTKGDMGRQISLLSKALNDANEGAAERAGLGDQYRAAMNEYRQASQLKNATDIAKKYIGRTLGGAALGGAGYGAFRAAREAAQ